MDCGWDVADKMKKKLNGSLFRPGGARVEDARPVTSFLGAFIERKLRGRRSRGDVLRKMVMVIVRKVKTKARRRV